MSTRCRFASLSFALMLSLSLSGCGGGGGGGSSASATPEPTPTPTPIVVPAPVAAFAASSASATVGQSLQFTDSSTGNPSSWAWSFGDGTSSTVQNPSHAYAAAGTFTVTLTATNAGGSSLANRVITVAAAGITPTAAFSVSPESPTAGQTVMFTDNSTATPTAWSWSFGDGATSKVQHATHSYAAAGSYTVTLTASNAEGSKTITRTVVVGAAAKPAFTMEQTLSDGAQRTTLAFSGLAMMTGNLEAQSFFPPGKVADYTGFQYLRDNDPDNMGHNTSFLTRVSYNVLYILTESQLAQLKALATAQLEAVNLYGYKRYALMKAFRRHLEGDVPTASSGLNLNAVKKASRELYLLDGQIAYDRAALYASIINSMSKDQKAYLDAMKGKGWSSWPNISNDQVKAKMSGLPQGTAVAVMTYAGDLFSWYAGSIDADIYFCPERHGTYYGGFYIKDAPAIGHEGYAIDEQLTATAGSALSDSSKGYVTQEQATVMSSLVATQRDNMYASATSNIVKVRTDIAVLLRSLLSPTTSASAVKIQVLALSSTYGDLDGANNHAYATVFAQVYKTLSAAQKTKLATLRKSIMSGTYADGTPFDFSTGTTFYLYSEPISNLSVLTPYTGNTDYLFFEPSN